MRRSRDALRARGGRLVQVKLDHHAKRALAALELAMPQTGRDDLVALALGNLAFQQRFPARLSRDEEIELARLANGPFSAAEFRKSGHADAFLAGLAIAFASDRELPRAKLLATARELGPELVNVDGYRRWLDASPIRLARLFKLVDVERGVARARSAT